MPLMERVQAALNRLPEGECRAAEVGVWLGEMSEQLLRRHTGLRLLMVDRWAAVPPGHSYRLSGSVIANATDEEFDAANGEAMSRTQFAGDRRTIMRGESTDMAALVPDASLHLVFLDDDHSREGCMDSLEAWYPKIMRCGWIGGHDYGHPKQGNVKDAVADFRAAHGITSRLELVQDRTYWWRVR